MNVVILCGRLTRDPEIRYSQGEKSMAIARFSLAVDRRGRKKEGTPTADFINCIAFDRTAEFIEKYIHKGSKLLIRGHIQTGSYEGKDGKKVYTTDVVVDETEFAESKAAASGAEKKQERNEKTYKQESFMDIPDDVDDGGLPFN